MLIGTFRVSNARDLSAICSDLSHAMSRFLPRRKSLRCNKWNKPTITRVLNVHPVWRSWDDLFCGNWDVGIEIFTKKWLWDLLLVWMYWRKVRRKRGKMESWKIRAKGNPLERLVDAMVAMTMVMPQPSHPSCTFFLSYFPLFWSSSFLCSFLFTLCIPFYFNLTCPFLSWDISFLLKFYKNLLCEKWDKKYACKEKYIYIYILIDIKKLYML